MAEICFGSVGCSRDRGEKENIYNQETSAVVTGFRNETGIKGHVFVGEFETLSLE